MVFKSVLSLALASLVSYSAPASTTRIVRNDAELESALKDYRNVSLLLVAPGKYERLTLNAVNPSRQIKIQAQNDLNPPEFKSLTIASSSNIALRNLVITRVRGAEPVYSKLAQIVSSSNIQAQYIYFHGSIDGNPSNDMTGLYIRQSKSVSILNSKFEESTLATLIDRCDGVNITNSEFVHLGRDAIDIAGSSNVLISDNIIHDFILTPGEHPDAVQAWTSNQDIGVRNVKVINNLILGGPAERIQGVFMRDERSLWKVGRGHSGILIAQNTIAYPLWNGIYLDNIQNAQVSQNRVLNGPGGPPVPGGPVMPWISVSRGTLLDRNEAPRFVMDGKLITPPQGNKVLGKQDLSGLIRTATAQWRTDHGNITYGTTRP